MNKPAILGVLCILVLAAAATAGLVSVDSSISKQTEIPLPRESATDPQPYINQGKSYLISHNILAARDQFKLAVEADSTNQEANLLYGVTRVFAAVEDAPTIPTTGLDSVREIFELSGFVFSQFNIYGSTYTAPHEFAADTPRTGAILDFLNSKFLTEVNGAISNLAIVTNTAFSSVIDASSINNGSGVSITIDYADALVIKSLLQVIKCNLELLMVYGLDVSLPDIQAGKDQLMTYKHLFDDSTFLTAKEPARLATAKTALIDFVDNYNSAAQYLKNRSGSAHHLFVIDVPLSDEAASVTSQNLDKIGEDLAKLKTGLNGGTYLLPIKKMKDQDRFVDLSKFFDSDHPIVFRTQLANCTDGTVLADPTLGGLFPLGLSAAASSVKPGITGDILGVACTGRETPLIKFEPDSIWLSEYYGPRPQSLIISNHGTANLVVDSVNLIGLNSSEFTLSPGDCGTIPPYTLAPGASCTAQVDLTTPPQYSWLNADIQFDSNDVSSPRTFVGLQGYTSAVGTSPPPSGTFTITYSPVGTGSGSIEFSVNLYSSWDYGTCPGACSGPVETGGNIEIRPLPAQGSYFSGWTGCDSVEGDTCNVTMYSDKTVTATFTGDTRTPTVMAYPPSGSYYSPQTVTLAANKEAAIYYTLNGTAPSASSTPYTGPFPIASPTTILKYIAIDPFGTHSAVKTETYTWLANPTLTVNTDGSGGGTINSTSPQSGLIVCSRPSQPGDICATTQTSGTIVTISATPDSTSLFSGWSVGSCPGTDPCSIALNSDTTVTGTFATMPPVKVETSGYPTTYHSTIQDAFAHTYANSTIRLQGGDIYEINPSFSQSFPITIMGGYDAGFVAHTDYSYLQGIFTIVSGSAIIDKLIIK